MLKKLVSSVLALALVFSLAACQQTPPASSDVTSAPPSESSEATKAPEATPEPAAPAEDDRVLIIGVDANFDEKWNPFVANSAYDIQVLDQIFTPVQMLNADNELTPYGGSCTAEEQADGSVIYTIKVNEGMTFSDGQPVTIDDYLYYIYVCADPSYTGPASIQAADIEGMKEYFYDDPNYAGKVDAIVKEAADKYAPDKITFEDFLIYAQEDPDFAGSIDDMVKYIEAEDQKYKDMLAAVDKTKLEDVLKVYAQIEYDKYKADYDTVTFFTKKLEKELAQENLAGGVKVPEISGVKRVDDYTATVKYNSIDIYADRTISQVSITPKHYYGEITKGDVSKIESNMSPLGSGPYVWGGFDSNIATATANATFFKGAPKIQTVRWQYVPQADIMTSLKSGAIDIANPTGNKQNVDELKASGLRYDLLDNAGYGYLGMNTANMPLDVRKGVWSLMNRAPAVEGYYGELASVIERPMTTVVAEYPKDATIYYPYDPAKALEYFQAAGYTQKDGKLVDSKGKQLTVNVYVGGGGKGEHPAYAMLVQAAEDMKTLGGELQIQDVDFNVLTAAMDDGSADMFCLAWSNVNTCDKTQQFHSKGGTNRYKFYDDKMDTLLEDILKTVDLDARSKLVSDMLDYAMENALELPLYQRKNIIAYNDTNLNLDTVPTATTFYNYGNELYNVEFKAQ